MEWYEHVAKWRDCKRCPLHTQRKYVVLGKGTQPCDVLFIGEAPGDSENLSGLPFHGPAGKALDAITARAWEKIGMVPSCAYTNVVGCYPAEAKKTADHRPEPNEIEACRPRLAEMIDMFKPRLVVAVGSLSDTYFPAALESGILYAGGRVEGHPTIVRWASIIHPAKILRSPFVAQDYLAKNAVLAIADAARKVFIDHN